ncbi:hypothetical protein Tco_0569077 [Tanacetum coccineum]
MEQEHNKKQNNGFLSTVVRGLSPGRTRGKSPLRTRVSLAALFTSKPKQQQQPVVMMIGRSGSMTLAPLMEGPDQDGPEVKRVGSGIGNWVREHLMTSSSVGCRQQQQQQQQQKSDLRMLLGVMAAPLAPVNGGQTFLAHLCIKDTPIKKASSEGFKILAGSAVEKINETQQKVGAGFEEQFKSFSGQLAFLQEDFKILLCKHLSQAPRHRCEYCSSDTEMMK